VPPLVADLLFRILEAKHLKPRRPNSFFTLLDATPDRLKRFFDAPPNGFLLVLQTCYSTNKTDRHPLELLGTGSLSQPDDNLATFDKRHEANP
jgi:hypothetical protein